MCVETYTPGMIPRFLHQSFPVKLFWSVCVVIPLHGSLIPQPAYLRKVCMNIHTNNQVTRIYNVIGKIRGAQEPGTRNPSFCITQLVLTCRLQRGYTNKFDVCIQYDI